jgi:formylglycine-generating enzyme required for sulfatase activity
VARQFGGPTSDFRDEHPRHEVRITTPLLAGAMEVTRGQFSRFVEETDYVTDMENAVTVLDKRTGETREMKTPDWRHPAYELNDNHPITHVTYDDAMAFCKWLSEKEGLTYRLPTEAEWEHMCRGGLDDRTWWWGEEEDEVDNNANVAARGQWRHTFFRHRGDNYKYAAPVGKFNPNPWGLHDTIGNVWEWTSDYYDPAYYENAPAEDPQGPPEGNEHVLRGGSWIGPAYCRAAYRGTLTQSPERGLHDVGFRVVCEMPQQ